MATEKLYKVKILGREKDKVQTLDFLHKKPIYLLVNHKKMQSGTGHMLLRRWKFACRGTPREGELP